eukprot:TRINITY_DN21498_c0_g1_i1.p1 TRINITY_DN21498_c0_g1~~TRINITY_DN21498_c0_g1_i1.p1  ORF type:complete len:671 (+),score=188.08 TRINITY_DN21498_c0_g1_i1:77-2089(+)
MMSAGRRAYNFLPMQLETPEGEPSLTPQLRCSPQMPLSDVAAMFLSARVGADGSSSAVAVMSGAESPGGMESASMLGVVTEDDLLHGYIRGAPGASSVGSWLRGREALQKETSESRAAKRRRLGDNSCSADPLPPSELQQKKRRERAPEPGTALPAGSTVQQLVQALLAAPDRGALTVATAAEEGDVAPAAAAKIGVREALWAFRERIPLSEDASRLLSPAPALQQPKAEEGQEDVALAAEPAAKEEGENESIPDVDWDLPHDRFLQQPPAEAAREPSAPEPASAGTLAEAPRATEASADDPSMQDDQRHPSPAAVGDVAAQRETAVCLRSHRLADACDLMLATHRTAALVLDDQAEGVVCGVLTENDLLRAHLDGEPWWQMSIGTWLEGGEARLPGFMVPVLTLPAQAPLEEAVRCLAAMAEEDETLPYACHHLLVRVPSNARSTELGTSAGAARHRLLSALDIAMGMFRAAAQAGDAGRDAAASAAVKAAVAAAALPVRRAMKPRSYVPVCHADDSLSSVFEALNDSTQNLALVESKAGESAPALLGVVTTADVLRACGERRQATGATGSWLRSHMRTPEERTVTAHARLADAVSVMATTGVHHLLVVEQQGNGDAGDVAADEIQAQETAPTVVGVLSALDAVCALAEELEAFRGAPKQQKAAANAGG